MKKITAAAAITIILLLPSCESLFNSVSFYPDRDFTVSRLPGYVKHLELLTDDGIKLEALYFSHDAVSDKIVVYFHGNAGNLYNRIKEANVIFDMGCNVIISGYRGYGGSTGKPSEEGIYSDGKAVLNYVTSVLGYKPGKIYVYGRSLGTVVAVEISQNIDYGGVILVTPLTSAGDSLELRYPSVPSFIAGKRFHSIGKINNLRSPVLVIHGTSDEIIPYSLGVKLYDAYNGTKRFISIPGGGHNNLENVNPDLYWGSVKTFIEK